MKPLKKTSKSTKAIRNRNAGPQLKGEKSRAVPRPFPFECSNSPSAVIVRIAGRYEAALLKLRDRLRNEDLVPKKPSMAEQATQSQLESLLRCQGIFNIRRGKKIRIRKGAGGVRYPVMTRGQGAIAGIVEDVNWKLTRTGKLKRLLEESPITHHVVLGHENLFCGTHGPDEVWASYARFWLRFDKLWAELNHFAPGCLVAIEMDRVREGKQRGVWIHAHLLIPGPIEVEDLERVIFYTWDASIRGKESNFHDITTHSDEMVRERAFRYVLGVTSQMGRPFAKHLVGFSPPPKALKNMRKKWNENGSVIPKQLWMYLAFHAKAKASRGTVRWKGSWYHSAPRSSHKTR